MLMIVGGVVLFAAIVGMTRTISARRARPHPGKSAGATFNEQGIVVGAEPLRLQGTSDRGVLLLHGFNDTPQSVGQLAHALHERGWSVSVPLLPHHGRGSADFERFGNAKEWVDAARAEWQSVCARSPRAVLAGQSMGGAIAVVLAAERAPGALVLLAPYLSMGLMARLLAAIWPVWELFTPKLASDSLRGLRDAEARSRALGNPWFTPRLVAELHQVVRAAHQALPAVHAPSLVLHTRLDYRIPSRSATRAYEHLGSADKTLVWRDDSGHVLAADAGREEVYALVGDWLESRIKSR